MRSAETEAVTWLALTTVVRRDVPFHWTTAPDAKPLPFTVSVKAGAPATTEFGFNAVMCGGAPILNGALFEVMPPEITVIVAVP